MEVGGVVQSNEERGVEKSMDDYLKSIGLHRKKIAKDGSCLFRAVAEQVLHCQSLHAEVRAKCVEFLKRNRDSYEAFIEGDFEEYLCKLQDPQQWVGEVEINALAVMYKRDFLIYQEPGKPPVHITDNNFEDKVQLCFLNGNHYDSVYPISHIKSAAICQSILYELLYDGVFKVDRNYLGPCQRISRANDLLSDDNMAACASSDESDLDTGDALWVENGTGSTSTRHNNQSYRGRGRGRQLPERVRRSLNPTLLRNIEYDVWHKTKRAQQKMDYCIAAGMHFTVGDRCQVRLEGSGRSYSATIKEVPPNNGPVTVYIEELGRRQVSLWSLRPPSDAGSWSTVSSRDKKLSNGHGEWEERVKGRGRGKAVAASSSVPAATAQGTAGRVQKQHSWPPQATVEEQGAAKPTRKSVSAAESAFGLTDEQRLAKEEEKRNVALVEIQLRDEQSFPALGTQHEGGKRKGAEKKRTQRNKTKSPVEDVKAPSPKCLTPPPPTSSSAPETKTSNAAPPAESAPTWLGSIKAPNMASAAVVSYASAAGPAAKPAVTPPASAGVHAFVTPVLPPASSTPPPTFIAPIAPSSSSAQGLSRSTPPTSCLPLSPSPPSFHLPPAVPVQDVPAAPSAPSGPAAPSQSTNSLPKTGAPVTSSQTVQGQNPQSQSSAQEAQNHIAEKQTAVPQNQSQLSESENQVLMTQTSVPQTQTSVSQTQTSVPQPSVPQTQTSVSQTQTSVPQTQTSVSQTQTSVPQPSVPQTQPSVPQTQTSVPQTQTSVSQTQISVPQPSVPQTQTSVPQPSVPQTQTSVPQPSVPQTQTSVPQTQNQSPVPQSSQPLLHVQPPHPSQLPHPSLCLTSSSPPQSQTEAPPPPPPPQQPPHPPSLPCSAPLPQLSQFCQDPLYPGFPQGEKGDPAPTPGFSSSRMGDDLPQDVNILRFFFNLGLKAYTMHWIPPCMYLLPLQQAHAMQPKPCSRSPSPQYQPSNAPTRHQEAYPPTQYPPTTAPPQYPPTTAPPQYPPTSTPTQYPPTSAPTQYPPTSAPTQYPTTSAPTQYPPTSAPTQYPTTSAPTQYPTTSAPTQYPTTSAPTQYPTTSAPTQYPTTSAPHPQYPPTTTSPHYPSTSAPPQYDHQTHLPEPPCPAEPHFSQAGYPVPQPPPHRMPPWQQMPPPRTPPYTVGYSSTTPSYPIPPPTSQGYPPGHSPGHPLYPPAVPPYSPPSLGYQSPSAPEEPQVSQGAVEQLESANGDMMPGHGHVRIPGPLESPAAASVANANSRPVVPAGFTLKKEPGDGLTRAVLLVDPPLNNTPILALVSDPNVKDASAAMATMKPSSGSPASQSPYRGPRQPYVPLRVLESGQVSYQGAGAEPLSVGCSTEDDLQEMEGVRPLNIRGTRRNYRGGRGRGSSRRRHEGGMGAGPNYGQYHSFQRGRGRDRSY